MDQPRPVPSADADSTWLDCHVMDSDDNSSSSAEPSHHALWVRTDSSSSSGSTFASDMSPIFPALMDHAASAHARLTLAAAAAGPGDACPLTASSLSSAPTLDNSTSSSSPTLEDSTSPASDPGPRGVCGDGNAEPDPAFHSPSDRLDEMQWETGGDDDLAVPKIEPVEDDSFCLDDLQEATSGLNPDPDSAQPLAKAKAKRPRGRPRKLSIVTAIPVAGKAVKGRSKTGCITCRKRKKKCDEAKPRCMNCEKNAVVCEGYPEKQLWKSGKERAEEGCLPAITMQPIFVGLETAEDRIFWKHYNEHLSAIFTVEGEYRNGFRDLLVPLATQHQGMMHSLLSLASGHLDYDTPYGAKLLQASTAKVSADSLQKRGDFHHEEAIKHVCEDIDDQGDKSVAAGMLTARLGQMLCFVLESLAHGHSDTSQQLHYKAFLLLAKTSSLPNPVFFAFVAEMFYYHILADDLVFFPAPGASRLVSDGWTLNPPLFTPRLIGVADGLFALLLRVSTIRHRIRANIQRKSDPLVDYNSLYGASDIGDHIMDWMPQWPMGDSRERVTLLYKQMSWLYLKTTVCPPVSAHSASAAPRFYASRPRGAMMPPPLRSATTSCASSPSPELEAMVPGVPGVPNPRRHSIANPNMTSGSRPFLQQPSIRLPDPARAASSRDLRSSPPPIRLPPNHEAGISLAVDESLRLLESFAPSDPAQTLLLVPCVIVGTACYSPAERDRVHTAIRIVHGYTGLRNTAKALKILNEVWRLMDLGDHVGAWDWQGVAHRLGITNLF